MALGFSKKLDNLHAAVSLHIAHYNFCWRLSEPGKSGKLRMPPAMECGLVDRLWTLEDLYDAVTEHDRERESLARYRRLVKRLVLSNSTVTADGVENLKQPGPI